MQAAGCGRHHFDGWISSRSLAEDNRAQHRAGFASCGRSISRSVLRHESASDSRHNLSHRPRFRQHADGRGQPLPLRLVVSKRIHCPSRGTRRRAPVAALRRHQLSRRRLAQRAQNCKSNPNCRRLSYIRFRCDGVPEVRQENRSCGGDIRADGKGPGHQLGGLESMPARQGHGPVGRCRSGEHGHRDTALAAGGDALYR